MGKPSKLISNLSCLYILLPFLIFAAGWMKLYYAVPAVLLLVFCYWKVCKDAPELWFPDITRDNIIRSLFILGVIAVWVYMSGIGKFVYQNNDHPIRNVLFNILVEYDWPVINYDILPQNVGKFDVTALIYYIGYWLPSAVIGKIFGLRAGYYAQAVWAVLGIALVYYFICARAKKIVVWPLWIFIFFSGLDIAGVFLTNADIALYESIWHAEWWSIPYEYSSMTTQLFWVFNQAIPAWLCTILVWTQKNNRNIVFILACCLLTSTFPFVGLLLLVVFISITREYEALSSYRTLPRRVRAKEYIKCLVKDTSTIQNVVGGGIIGIISFLYLFGNSSGGRLMQEDPRGPAYYNSLPKLVLFLIVEVAVYAALLYKYNKENKMYYFILLLLCVIPPVKVGYSNDFCMRVSIPFLFILMLLVIEAVAKAWKEKDYGLFAGLLIVLLIGSVTPVLEIKRTWTYTYERINAGETVYAEDSDTVEVLNSGNFSGDISDNFFFKYIAK